MGKHWLAARSAGVLPAAFLIAACSGNPTLTSSSEIADAAPVSDTFITEARPLANLSQDQLLAVGTDTSGAVARAVLRLDLDPLTGILVETSDVQSAVLVLAIAFTSSDPAPVIMYPLLRPVGIAADTADSTGWSDWTYRTHASESWGAPGGEAEIDYDVANPIDTLFADAQTTQQVVDLSQWTRDVISGVLPNHGFYFKMQSESTPGVNVVYFSSQIPNAGFSPRLDVALFARDNL